MSNNELQGNLLAHNEGEVTYGGRVFFLKDNVLYVTVIENSIKELAHSDAINIDGKELFFQPIRDFGFSLSDFKDAPVNDFGLKVVAKFEGLELVVTANGLFVFYSDGYPSLHGLPSEVDVISGLYVNENNLLQLPRMSLFSHAELSSFALMFAPMSFNNFDLGLIKSVHQVRARRNGTQLLGEFSSSKPYTKEYYSDYEETYPKFTAGEYSTFLQIASEDGTESNGGLRRTTPKLGVDTRTSSGGESVQTASNYKENNKPISTNFLTRD